MVWNKIIIILAIEICAVYMLGRIFIPYFRRLKTGKLEFCLGDRFKKDGSEPKFGGIIIAASMGLGLFLGASVWLQATVSEKAEAVRGSRRHMYTVCCWRLWGLLKTMQRTAAGRRWDLKCGIRLRLSLL